ncbi:hypothetical protein DC522_31090 [Microvirga sp. KLBC 81]|uniref:hypothetical protein n=1 Tax=Microvirga sp. KLBC 81 TaxID=1862707 RepID=UPI000D5244F6|nr:hypothetical protein [Microvirga sp. KLBC 81]PVE20645.1 hypothetical protein DC522_31090 [Microvirga sp. KLBC 81]
MIEHATPRRAQRSIPDAFNILQAALWLIRGRKPVEDSAFAGAPIQLASDEINMSGPLGDFIYALRSGEIPASGGVAARLLNQPNSPPLPLPILSPNEKHELFPIKSHDWYFDQVDWNRYCLDYFPTESWGSAPLMPLSILCSENPRAQAFCRMYNDEKYSFSYFPVVVPREEFLRTFPHLPAPEHRSPEASEAGIKGRPNVGRPKGFDWEWMYIEAAAWIFENGLPETQQQLIDAMVVRCSERWGKDRIPADSTLKAKIRVLLDRLRDTN